MKNAGRRGFTLIEVLTVISVLVIVAGMMVRGGSPARETIALDRTASQIADMFRTARQNSITALEHEGVYPSYGVMVSPGSVDGAFGGYATLYAREVHEADVTEPERNEICYASGVAGVYTILNHTFSEGVYIRRVRHTEYNSGGPDVTDIDAGTEDNISVLFARPLPTTLMARSNNAPNRCGGGNPVYNTGILEITLSHTADADKMRIISVNNAGSVQVYVP